MIIPELPHLIRRMIKARLHKVAPRCAPLAASLVVIESRCGNKRCRCHRADRFKHKGNYITFKQHGKTRTVYVPLDLLDHVSEWVAEHKRIKTLLKEISNLNVALIKSHVKHTKHRPPKQRRSS